MKNEYIYIEHRSIEFRSHDYLRPFQYYDAARMRLWRETRALQTAAWVVMWVGVIVVGLCYLL